MYRENLRGKIIYSFENKLYINRGQIMLKKYYNIYDYMEKIAEVDEFEAILNGEAVLVVVETEQADPSVGLPENFIINAYDIKTKEEISLDSKEEDELISQYIDQRGSLQERKEDWRQHGRF
jgi:hypothetical protein